MVFDILAGLSMDSFKKFVKPLILGLYQLADLELIT